MNILLIHQAFVSPGEAGGTRHYEFARQIVDKGHRFKIIASDTQYLTGEKLTKKKRLIQHRNEKGVDIFIAYTCASIHRNYIWRVVSFLSFMFTSVLAGVSAGKADLVMGTSPPIFQALSSWAIARVRKVPFVLEIRDLWPEFAIDMGILKNSVIIELARLLEKFLYAQADHIIVNSPAYRDYLNEKAGVPLKKITLVPNGVDPKMFSKNDDADWVRQTYNLKDHFVVTYAGAIGAANDLSILLKAAKQFKKDDSVRFLIVGDGKLRRELENKAKQLKLENVVFTGALPKSKMPSIMAASDACTAVLKNIPMFKTTYPNKVFDYMAAARPTILAIDGVIRQVVEKAGGGIFVPPGDSEALADAVRKLSQNKTQAKKMGDAAKKYVTENFNRKNHAELFAKTLLSVKNARKETL